MIGLTVFIGVSLYAITTICITQWRKKFRENTNKFDNDFHDKATDSIINYETVKYFTGESFEIDRFVRSVVQFQKYTSSTQYSLSLLNIAQQVRLNYFVYIILLLTVYTQITSICCNLVQFFVL